MTLTRTHILHSNLIENVRDEKEIDQSMLAWNYLINEPRLTHKVVLETHRLVMMNLWPDIAGYYRDCNVEVGGRLCPRYEDIFRLMTDWLSDMDKYQVWTPRATHVDFEHIHPFRDGNGRTGRLLMWWHEEKLGIEPTLISYDERWNYYEWF